MNIKEFDKKLNESFGKYDVTGKEFLVDILLPKLKGKTFNLSGVFLIDLYKNFVLSGRTIAFDFNNKLIENDHFLFFATQDTFDIGVNKSNENVIMWDQEGERIQYLLAPDMETFLKIILEIYDYSLAGWFEEKKYTNDDRKELLNRIEKIMDKEYLDYFQISYGN